MMTRIKTWLVDRTGASAAELALLLTPLVLLLFGIVHLSLMVYSAQQLNYAAEATARCLVMASNSGSTSATCATNALAKSYFAANYHGVTSNLTWDNIDESQTCDTSTVADTNSQVAVQADYTINALLVHKAITLKARACFPHT
jgi:Flp pilus assembly protein TadG